jgi:PAS domain S-box-containing protein
MNPHLMVARAGLLQRAFLALLVFAGFLLVFGAAMLPDVISLSRYQLGAGLGLLLLLLLLVGVYMATLLSQRQARDDCQRAAAGRLAATLEYAPHVAVQWYDPQGRVLYWNGASERLFGWTAQEAIGKTLDQLILTPQEAQRFLTALAYLAASESVIGPNEATIRRRDGGKRVILSTMYCIPGDAGPIFVCMDTDISEREAAAQLEHQVRFRNLFEHAPVACLTLDTAGVVVDANSSLKDLLGTRGEDLLDTAFAEFWPDPAEFVRLFDALQASGVSRNEVALRHKDGHLVQVLLESRMLRDGDGRCSGAHCILFDLRGRPRLGAALDAALPEPCSV